MSITYDESGVTYDSTLYTYDGDESLTGDVYARIVRVYR